MKIEDKDINSLAQLHPAAQVAVVLGVAAVLCVFFWQLFKTLRST